jgi:hypothetical protein
MVVFISLEGLGGFIDGWAHNHFSRIETFFTPWHAMLYGGFASVAIYLLATCLYFHSKGYPWQRCAPRGYSLSILGLALFVLGGALDFTWHIFFGIERSISQLLSPTHLWLAVSEALIALGPVRSVLARGVSGSWWVNGPFVLGLSWLLDSAAFFTQFASPFGSTPAARPLHPLSSPVAQFVQAYGIASVVLQAAIVSGVLLYVVKQQRAPLGAFVILLADYASTTALMRGDEIRVAWPILVAVGLLSGIVIEALYRLLHPRPDRHAALHAFAFCAPLSLFGLYFVAVATTAGAAWPAHLLVGAPVMAGLVGLLASFLIDVP